MSTRARLSFPERPSRLVCCARPSRLGSPPWIRRLLALTWTSSRWSPTRSVPPRTRSLLTPTGSSAVTPSSAPLYGEVTRDTTVLPAGSPRQRASSFDRTPVGGGQRPPHSLLAPRITLAAVRRGPRPCRLCHSPPADPRGKGSARWRGSRQRPWLTEVRTQHRKRLTSNAGGSLNERLKCSENAAI
jgi:hypothetical protein